MQTPSPSQTQTPLAKRHAAAIAAACRLLEAETETTGPGPGLTTLAARAGMSPFHFHRVFKAATGLTPKGYAAAFRAARTREALAQSGSVTEAIHRVGYSSSSRFYSRADAMLGMHPKAFRKGGAGETIRFAVGECSLGSILVASSAKGVCAILLGDDPDALLRNLQDRFPRATLVGGDRVYETVVAQVVGLVEAPGTSFGLPLDVRGTAFQQRVWEALRAIPAGSTRSYSEIAAQIGAPRACRAVAQACGANPVAVAIPCHRVLRNDGKLCGYRWGVQRKAALLKKEKESR